ncbi:tryptophan 7-halogenase [Colwellia sp. MSW7]|uniref:Tryptophan 7-halogenase n=1 Tax=Colwellia maritima TaxID=2912588 RepID=A0ABS9X0T3_9GAMM|nr:tryptophan halogenase family protein [Colwellia maritima]MCI2283076.1 tryptophan 7-halogenase [Colwellia maritima]
MHKSSENKRTFLKPTKTVVVVGGGIAGRLTAGRIAAKHKANTKTGLNVVLVESSTIPAIGVGEGTWPTMRSTLIALGISETDFIRECDASFKQGAKFAKWVDGNDDDFYYHPLVLPQGYGKGELAAHWLAKQDKEGVSSFSNEVCFQEAVCEEGLAPKTIRTAEFADVANYAYHLDSGKFAVFLQKHCTNKLGVRHVLDDVIAVNSTDNNDISSVSTQNNGDISGELFVDCTGFSSLLLGKHYDVPFTSCNDVLFIDTALAVQVPYDDEDSTIASHTISTGQEAGWIWDIGLQHRRGVGYVYSSKYSSEEEARTVLAEYVGEKIESLSIRKIPIVSGHREKFWQNNCVAVGLSAGFLEPLESSALVMVELAAQMIAEQLPLSRDVMDVVAKRFNETALYRWQKIIDFLKLHYILNKRSEPFWVDNRNQNTIPQSLQEMMLVWKYRSPTDCDFTSNNEVFPAASYQYVLYGMGFKSDYSHTPYILDDVDFVEQQFAKTKKLAAKAVATLPTNRELINKVKAYGFNVI